MQTNEAHPQERTAREMLTQSPGLFVGVAGDVAVYYDSTERAFAVIGNDGDAERVELDETPFATPAEYCAHIRNQRGWDTGPRIGGSLTEDFRRGLVAAR